MQHHLPFTHAPALEAPSAPGTLGCWVNLHFLHLHTLWLIKRTKIAEPEFRYCLCMCGNKAITERFFRYHPDRPCVGGVSAAIAEIAFR